MSRRFSKILIANRGEIACRVIRSARAQGYSTVAVYSDADAAALHVELADEAVHLGPSPVGESYLVAEKVIAAAKKSGADAVHPGYGFLSENAAFAAACADAGLVFIGPPASAINAMGNKAEAKRLMLKAKVPCVPGYEGKDQDTALLKDEAAKIGFPILLKAAAGGGGRGMRTVRGPAELDDAIATARAEAKNAFGSDELIIEKLVESARHVEIQIIADEHGNCIHLGERDCSVQRRHQKIIEESPCPVMTPELRKAMGAAAVQAAKAGGYVNAGTVEFLLDDNLNFYFLEMNTRLQVEHPVTEMVTGLDLVALQFAVAQGEALPIRQEDVQLHGHAIEVRLYAEDPAQNFAPQIGKIHTWQPAALDGVRVDHGLKSSAEITPFYDAMIAKIITHGKNRDEARNKMLSALRETRLLGVQTNAALLRDILVHPEFAAGGARTHFIESTRILNVEVPKPDAYRQLIAAAVFIERDAAGVPTSLKGWRSTGPATHPVKLEWNGEKFDLRVLMQGARYSLKNGGETIGFTVDEFGGGVIRLHDAGHSTAAHYAIHGGEVFLELDGRVDRFLDLTYAPPATAGALADGVLKAPMVGQVVAVHVAAGDTVAKGQVLLVLEAMKMVNQITAPFDAVVESISVSKGGQVKTNQPLLKLAPQAQ